ncbi:hypothetical protein HC026_02235 [Lactobacillus sp. LC28-10]|uniref:Calcineurin-like phosphoesterase domain-containing protein n=1 Tax=Secundilactobacillus angelensis TaxID=2722706 RepID=A0ABX1KVT9_9LACO|nr:metallophosphoesterase [Secundilactobacillus angelensis]MCH5461453.1 metallophosphoesterase [Secundilactobacillus angelensis]NLR17734.1 hypothetical protein [Secundilactobacillus angelensis]
MKQLHNRFLDNLIDGQVISQSGTFTPKQFLVSRQTPNRLSPRLTIYHAHQPVPYLAKLKSDGWYWLVLEDGYLCVAIGNQVLRGHDSNPSWNATEEPAKGSIRPTKHFETQAPYFVAAEPLHFYTMPSLEATETTQLLDTGEAIVYSNKLRKQSFLFLETSRGFLPYYNSKTGKQYGVIVSPRLDLHQSSLAAQPTLFKMHGSFRFNRRDVDIYQLPDLNSPIIGHLDRYSEVSYTGKLADRHRGWLQLSFTDQMAYVPFMSRYPHFEHYFGREITGSKTVTRLSEPWSFTRCNSQVDLRTTQSEVKELKHVANQLNRVRQSDSIVIGLINDTHYDSHQSSYSQRTIHDLQLISDFASKHHFDGLVMNGDLVDGNQTLDRTIIDTGNAVSALLAGRLPTFITQGNHDDNSGFARYLNGFRTEQVMTEQTALNLRNKPNNSWLASQDNFYGKYKVPGTSVSLIMLNTFDIRDSFSDGYYDRDYDDQPNGIHWTGILQNIRHSRSRIASEQADWLSKNLDQLAADEQVIIFTHDSIRSATDKQAVKPFWTYDWFANNQQGSFSQVYNCLVKHRQQIIAVMSGHTHVDDWSQQDGISWITTTSDIADRRKTSRLNSKSLGAWDILVINPKQRQLFRLRYGWRDYAGRIRNWQYRLFGDGTDTRHPSIKTFFNQPDPHPTGNALYYQNQNKQVDQVWHGFRGYFDY